MAAIRFEILGRSAVTGARVGRVETLHGGFDTPAFMPVGTKATVKGLLPDVVAGTGSEVLLNNTYHLMLRPGSGLIAEMGGVHRFMGWDGPILTDSGGFQVYSLSDARHIDEDGVTFRSHVDGAEERLTPERSVGIQNELGADIIMAFDDCPPAPVAGDGDAAAVDGSGRARHGVAAAEYDARNLAAAARTRRWLERCVAAHGRGDEQALFGIVQGGVDLELRARCAAEVAALDLAGYAIGGCAVGEDYRTMMEIVSHTAGMLPADRPRYLMGVGYERDLLAAVKAGVDMFDCVLPTRNGRNANAFTPTGQIRVRNAGYARDGGPIDAGCDCLTCERFSRAYLRHLFMADEMLGPILVSLHNIRHFQRLMLDIRRAIRDDSWSLVERNWPVTVSPPVSSDS